MQELMLSSNNQHLNTGIRLGNFELTPTGLIIEGQPTYDEWEHVGLALRNAEQGIQFALGDWLNYGEKRSWEGKYTQALDETDYTKRTLETYAWVAKHVQTTIRIENLSFRHHQLVASYDPDQQSYWLERAAAGDGNGKHWSVADLRKRLREDGKRQKSIVAVDAPESDILHGDMQILYDTLPDNSVDLFFTDPPYHTDKVDTYTELAQLAAHKLKPGGLCLTYSGQMHLPQVLTSMSLYLSYWWIFAVRHTGGHLTIWNRNLWNDWKPVLVFAKPYADGTLPLAPEWVQDFIDGGGRDKQYHAWGQDADEATYWIEKLTEPDALVCDPYVGGGAIPTACKLTGRRWIGTEIDGEQAQIARKRLLDTTTK